MHAWGRLLWGGACALAVLASMSLFSDRAEAGRDCEILNDPLCVTDGLGGGSGGGGGGSGDNGDDSDIDLGVDVDSDGDNEVDAEVDVFGQTDAEVDLDGDGEAEIDTNDDSGSSGNDSNDIEADLDTVTEATGQITGALGSREDPIVLADALLDAVLITNTDLDAEINPIFSDDIVVLRLCHTSSLEGTELAFLDAAGNIVDVVANETGVNNVYVGINTDEPCDSAGPLSDGGDDGLIDRDIVVVGICHASAADSTQTGFIDLAGNTVDLVADEFAVNDVLVAVNTDRPCPGHEGEGAGDAFLDDDLVAVAICHTSGVNGEELILVNEAGNEISVLAEELAANEILVAINNGGLCPGEGDGAGDEDDDLLDGNLIVVGVCHVSELGTETLAFVDLAGNTVELANETFNTNDVLVLINTDSICPGSETPPGSGDGDDDDGGGDQVLTVGICLLTDVVSNTSVLTQIAGTPAQVDQQLEALGDLVLAVNRDDPCPSGGDGGGDDDDGGNGDDDDGGNGDDDDQVGGITDEDDDDEDASSGDSDEPFGDIQRLRSGEGGNGGPSLNTGGFGLVTNAVDEPWEMIIFAALVAAVAGGAGYLVYNRTRSQPL